MQIWSAEIKEIESLHPSIKGRFPELEKELDKLVKADDENMVLLYSRRCLEVMITDLCECELKRGRGTEPLKGIIDKLGHEKKVPSHIIASMDGLNTLSTFGTHPKDFETEQLKPVLSNLAIIIKWYLKNKDVQFSSQPKPDDTKYESKELFDTGKNISKSKKKLIPLFAGIIVTLAVIVAALFIFNVIDGKQTREPDKSIAVLPFVNDSKDEENTYFINGIMEEVLLNLQAIKELRVPGRTSVEQYRNTVKSIPEIARELGVSYIVEGSGQKYGNIFRLRIQLLEGAKDRHLWGESYEEVIDSPDDIFRIQIRIAESIAAELKAFITPEEKQLIEKVPTTNLTAYDFFQKGRDEHTKYWIDNNNSDALKKAEIFYHEALQYDSTHAQSYTGLAWAYWNKHYWESYLSEGFLDSVLILCDIALSYDNQLSDAYTLKGWYYNELDKPEMAIEEYDKAIKLNPNDYLAYWGQGIMYFNYDRIKSIDNLLKAISLYRGSLLPNMFRYIGFVYGETGFIEKGNDYMHEAFKLERDSARYYDDLASMEFLSENYGKAVEFMEKAYLIDTNNTGIQWDFGLYSMYFNQYEKSLKYFEKWLNSHEVLREGSLFGMHRIGWAYWKNGNKEKAEYFFNEQINICSRLIELGRVLKEDLRIYYDLAGVYAFTGEKEKAYDNLRLYNQNQLMTLWMVSSIKHDPLFDNIRDETEFQQIVKDIEAKYQAEHERVRKWMEEQGTS